MTCYHGGKQRIGKEISLIINDILRDKKIEGYCEPFCGMLGVYRHIDNYQNKKYLAGDLNGSLVSFWENKYIPEKTISKQEYLKLKTIKQDTPEKGFYGFFNGFMGRYFGSYFTKTKEKTRFDNTVKRIIDFHNNLPNVFFSKGSYNQYDNLKNFVIYCDPPYQNTNCNYLEKFDSDKFYEWCKRMSKYNIVLVSSYMVPDNLNWSVVWEKDIKLSGAAISSHMTGIRTSKRTERLYLVNKI